MDEFAPFFLTLCVGFCLGVMAHAITVNHDWLEFWSFLKRGGRLPGAEDTSSMVTPPPDYISLDGDIFAPGVLEDAIKRYKETPPDKRTHISIDNQNRYFTTREDFNAWMAKNGTASGLPSRKVKTMQDFWEALSDDDKERHLENPNFVPPPPAPKPSAYPPSSIDR